MRALRDSSNDAVRRIVLCYGFEASSEDIGGYRPSRQLFDIVSDERP